MPDSTSPDRPGLDRAALALLIALALLMRALGFEWVFLDDGVVFPPGDPQYHLRRALYTFVNFPDVLLFDPYINHPGGAPVPWPPLFDFVVGATAWLLADGVYGFELVAAWAGTVMGALTVIPIHRVGVRIASREVALCAGILYALLPIGINYSRVGNTDHHAAVSLIGAWILYACVELVQSADRPVRLLRMGALLALLRLALLLTWHGSLLYLALAEGLLLLTAVLTERPALLLAQSLGAAVTAACLAPILLVMPTPLGGEYSSIALSQLHLLALLAAAAVAGLLWTIMWRRPGLSARFRLGWLLGTTLAVLLALIALPGPRAGLVPALQFMTMSDGVGLITGEQSPLFSLLGRVPGRPATLSWGWLGYLIPVAPFAGVLLAARAPASSSRRAAAGLLAAWGAFFGVLAVAQRRYGNDFAPAAAVLFAIGAMEAGRLVAARVARPRWSAALAFATAVLLCLTLLWPALAQLHGPRARASWAALKGDAWPRQQAEQGVAATLARFTREVRRVTPETSAYLGDGRSPEYGVLAHANLGHALQYGARRATATDPFWAYIGPLNWQRSFAFLATDDEREALRLARRLRGRYVVTMPGARRRSVVARLHERDGAAEGGRPALGHFRLIAEAAMGGQSIGEIFGQPKAGGTPYKLFEVVKGAMLEVLVAPGVEVVASIRLETPRGRELVYEKRSRAGLSGIARLRVPYATGRSVATRALGPYHVVAGERRIPVEVAEAAVQRGDTVRVSARQ